MEKTISELKGKLKIEYVPITKLRPNEYNPKQMSEKEASDLEKSIVEFGIVDPLIVNKAKGREGIIIGGHQRYKIYKKLNFKEVPVIKLNIPDINKEQELCLRLSKNQGEWNLDLLVGFDKNLLKDIGFEEDELKMMFGLGDIEEMELDLERFNIIMINPPEAPKLKERIGLYFDNINNYKKVKNAIMEGKISSNDLLNLI